MFHLEQGWWLGVKSCSARTIYTNAEGRKGEVDISVSLAGAQTNPWCVCFYLCADWWNELWVWEIDSGWGWSSSFPFLACLLACWSAFCVHSSLLTPSLPLASWFSSIVFSNGGQHKQGGISCSFCPLLSDYMSLGTGEALASLLSFIHCFVLPASQIICLLWESLQPSCLIFHETFSL